MGSIPDDRRAAAVIRDTAMTLFAERGAAGVTVREIGAAAGVSPGLVMHHFGSKKGLKDAVDRHTVVLLDDMVAELVRLGEQGGAVSLTELFITRLEREPALAGYVSRLLVDDSGPGDALFEKLFETTVAAMRQLTSGGSVRASQDESVRAAFLLVNDLALVLLRRRIENVIGVDPLSRDGLARWSATVFDVYDNGIFVASGNAGPAPGDQL